MTRREAQQQVKQAATQRRHLHAEANERRKLGNEALIAALVAARESSANEAEVAAWAGMSRQRVWLLLRSKSPGRL